MGERTGRLRRSDRILRSRDFQRVARRGKRLASAQFVVLVAAWREVPSDEEPYRFAEGRLPRLGITTSRKVGNAVIRNRLRRRIREWFRAARHEMRTSTDVVVIARPPAALMSGAQVHDGLSRLLEIPGSGKPA